MKKYLVLGLVAVLVFSIVLVLAAKPDFTEKTHPSGKMVAMPAHAVEVAPGVFYLGKAVDKGKVVEGYAFMLKSKKEFVKPVTDCGNGICELGENARKCPADCGGGDPEEPDTSSCYGFLSKGAKWKTVEDYVVNLYNDDGLNEGFIVDNLAMDIDKWEFAVGVNILGEGSSTSDSLEADFNAPDNQNEVYFSNLGETNTIAFAVVWGIFGGPPPFRELVEWDMVFNDAFTWSEDATGLTTEMDFENIATHELGHAVGLGDLYTSECSEQTMYGYASYGETKKRTLEDGDKTGIKILYG